MVTQTNQHYDRLVGKIGLAGRGIVGDGADEGFFFCGSRITSALLLF